MARLLEYENYKDLNGVKIPDSWELSKVKHLGNYLNGFAFKPTHWTDKGIPIIRIQNLTNQDADINRTSFIAPERYHVFKGDILISWSATLDVYIWQKEEAWLNQHIYKVKVNRNKIIEKYFYWTAKWFMGELNESSHGSTMQHLTTDKFGSFNVPLPPISEQYLITNFLDYETAQIDTLIEKQQTLIQLLKEKRQAVISHAVTKGLNPDAPMKESGVEWLGEVPEHWEVKKNKHLLEFVTSGSRGWAEYYSDEGKLFFRITNLTRDTIEPKLESIKNVNPPYGAEGERSKIELNDLLISITADLGSVCVANDSITGGFVSQHVSLCRPNPSVKSARWLAYFILSDSAKEQFAGSGYGGTKIQLSLEDIRELNIAYPPEKEQENIASYIDNKLEKFETLMSQAEQAIQLMQERRTALISAAVTGKIDVRGWVAPDSK